MQVCRDKLRSVRISRKANVFTLLPLFTVIATNLHRTTENLQDPRLTPVDGVI